ncbi:DUF1636 family protein [Oceaniglobus trochenteri]|uniref:DUF1636 family protein n=1 Tax=Oceaniglobus trochenteri TaxID=2763260 RepID=UPI001CFFE2E2|nr:DUF1636 family protein [Oceaniglobus trochenteri]
MSHEILICRSCQAGGRALGAALIDALGVPGGYALRQVDCMTMCGEPVSLAFRSPGKATYLFSGVNAGDCADIHGFAELYAQAPDGWIEDARRAGRLRLCLKGRVPA